MAGKRKERKEKKSEVVESKQAEVCSVQIWTEQKETPAVKPQQETAKDPAMFLHQAARQYISNFKEHWWHSIASHAKGMGLNPNLEMTHDQCLTVLRHWGAKV